ncbi:MAG: 1-acyl-sn-glycerol-3-phosphate acyltransferase [Oscillospiraceae bacterium]|nr:1-acyl-sn-glycerol-3-phosphate acyltransferase [Oscillospiraceae bacterium]
MTKFYRFALSLVRIVMHACFRIRMVGKENLPTTGGYLFVSNHRSNLDPVIIPMLNPKTQFCIIAKQELFQNKMIGWLLRTLGGIAIDRGTGDLSALDELTQRLEQGRNGLIFPEGTRSKDGTLLRFKSGAAYIVAQTGAPVVPVAMIYQGKLRFRSRITVHFGTPITLLEEKLTEPNPRELKRVKQEMYDAVAALMPPAEESAAKE